MLVHMFSTSRVYSSRSLSTRLRVALLTSLTILLFVVLPIRERISLAQGPDVNDRFPVHEPSNLSPPVVHPLIHECAIKVWVDGIPEAVFEVFAKNLTTGVDELVGKDSLVLGSGEIKLKRTLVLGEMVTAQQTFAGVTSGRSYDAVPVLEYPKTLNKPVIGEIGKNFSTGAVEFISDIYECGQIVPVSNLNESTHIEVSDLDGFAVIGTGEETRTTEPVVTKKLVSGHRISAQQTRCPLDASKRKSSVASDAVKVKPDPALPMPSVDKPAKGTKAVVIHNQLVGAEITIKDKATSAILGVSLGAANGDGTAVLSKPVTGDILVTQALCSPSPTASVPVTNSLNPPKLNGPICPGSHFVAVDNTTPFAKVVLVRNGDTLHPIGYWGGSLTTILVPVGTGVNLKAGDKLTIHEYIGSVIAVSNDVFVGCDNGGNVVTQHNDNFRTGAYLAETILTPDKVGKNGLHERYRIPLNGNVITQPLYVREVAFTTGGANGVFVGTTDNSFYAYDPNTGVQKWKIDLLDSDPHGRQIAYGVETTPVIDVTSNRIYVLFSTGNTDLPKKVEDFKNPKVERAYWLVALDLRSGTELARVRVAPSVFASDGTVQPFIAKNQTAHPALLLDHGSIYGAFGAEAGSEQDKDYFTNFHGWVVKYRASDLAPQATFCTSPNRDPRPNLQPGASTLPAAGSGIWQGGGGLAADPDGNVYFLTGNGRLEVENSLYGDSFLKLTTFGSTLVPTAFVPKPLGGPEPDPDPDLIEKNDVDLGSGGALLIPGFNLAIGGGKTGWLYLLDRTAMQLQQRITGATNTYICAIIAGAPPCPPDPYQGRFWTWDSGPHLHGSPTFWQGSNLLYVWGEKDFLHAFPFNPATQRFDDSVPPALKGPFPALPLPMPGAMMSLSARNNAPGSGVLWAIVSVENKRDPNLINGRLYAFDAGNLRLLCDVKLGHVPHMALPTVADGKVFATTHDQELVIYDLGAENNNLNYIPTTPGLSLTKCQGCHQAAEIEDLQRRHPWSERYINEASIWALPTRALQSVSPPRRVQRVLAVEGNGTQSYVAVEKQGRLVWTLKETTADLLELGPDGEVKPERSARVRLGAGAVFTADDNSRIVGRLQKTVPAPSAANVPWTLFRTTASSVAGILNGVSYVQCVYTHAGQAPAARPQRSGQVSHVPYVAQYRFYR